MSIGNGHDNQETWPTTWRLYREIIHSILFEKENIESLEVHDFVSSSTRGEKQN